MASATHDIVIAGGGMIGSSLALALAPLGLSTVIVEPVPRRATAQPSFDDRSTALSRSTQRMFEALELWPAIANAAAPIRRIHVSDRGRFGFSHIDAAEQGVEALGYVIINRVLGEVLAGALTSAATVEELCPARVVAVQPGDEAVRVLVEQEGGRSRELLAKLLIAADGADSPVREMLGIPASRRHYGQRAIIGNLVTGKSLDGTAFERFTEDGPLAILPTTEGRAAFVWTVSERNADRVLALQDDAFLAELEAVFGERLGRFSRVGRRASYALCLNKASRLTADRSVLVGNAAHGLHPVAAQGFNLGIRDVAALCDCVADQAGRERADPGRPEVLRRYSSWRRSDQSRVVSITDGLVRVFGSPHPAARFARDVGMLGLDLLPGAKRLFARRLMGLEGRLPRLSRGVPIR